MSGHCDGYSTVNRISVRVAKKTHECSACGRVIEPGHRYVYQWWLYEDQASSVKRCGACELTYQHLVEKCEEASRERYVLLWPMADLGCGLRYESEWGDLPSEVAAYAFMTDDEASGLLEGT